MNNYAIYYKGECLYNGLRLIDAEDMKEHYDYDNKWEIKIEDNPKMER